MKKLYLIAFVMLLLATNSFSQRATGGLVTCEPTSGYTQTRSLSADSASFASFFVFDIPEGCRSDTLYLMVYGDALLYDQMDININSQFGFKKSTKSGRDRSYYAWQKDSTAVKDDWNTEAYMEAYLLVPAAADTLENTTAGLFPVYDAVKISMISGGTGNGSDVDFWIKLLGVADNDK